MIILATTDFNEMTWADKGSCNMTDAIEGHGILLPYATTETYRGQKPWNILKSSPCGSIILSR